MTPLLINELGYTNAKMKNSVVVNRQGKRYQFLEEACESQKLLHTFYCAYKGQVVLYNRTRDYNPEKHVFEH